MSKKEQAHEPSARRALADAIQARDDFRREVEQFAEARERVLTDLRKARDAEEEAQSAVEAAADVDREALAEAYAAGAEPPPESDAKEAKALEALSLARRKVSNLQAISQTLAKREMERNGSLQVLNTKVGEAVKELVLQSPEVERLVNDYVAAKRAFNVYFSTARWLAFQGLIPAHLSEVAPRPHETYFHPPDPAWENAIEALSKDANAQLP